MVNTYPSSFHIRALTLLTLMYILMRSVDEVTIMRGAIDMARKTVAEIMTPVNQVFMLDFEAHLDRDTMKKVHSASCLTWKWVHGEDIYSSAENYATHTLFSEYSVKERALTI